MRLRITASLLVAVLALGAAAQSWVCESICSAPARSGKPEAADRGGHHAVQALPNHCHESPGIRSHRRCANGSELEAAGDVALVSARKTPAAAVAAKALPGTEQAVTFTPLQPLTGPEPHTSPPGVSVLRI